MARTRRRSHPQPGALTLERPESKYGSRGNARHKNVRQPKPTEPTKPKRNRR
jgi:hypothetical protein